MPPRVRGVAHLTLVGTSILRNMARMLADRTSEARGYLAGQGYDVDELARIAARCASPPPGSEEDAACLYGDHARLLEKAGVDLLDHQPYLASAELNAMRPWHQALRSGGRGAAERVYLFASDTGAGQLAARILRGHFERLGVDVRMTVVRDLGVPGRFTQGLRSLARELLGAGSVEARERAVALNLTGGFKAEASAALLAAAPVADAAYYAHEAFRETVVIPLRPFVDRKSVIQALSVVERAEGGVLVRDPPEWLERLVSALAATGLARFMDDAALLSGDLYRLLLDLAHG